MINLDRRYLAAAMALVLVLAFWGGIKYNQIKDRPADDAELLTPIENDNPGQKSTEQVIQVYVTGEVENPGVYKLKPGARVYEAIDMARALPAADLKNLNLARKLEDGEAVVVSSLADAAGNVVEGGDSPAQVQAGTGNKSVRVGTGKVNINTASPQELDEKLPGIGPALAQRIVDYRTSQGRFGSIEDIKEVSGIGDKKYEAIKDLITVQ